MGLTYQKCLDLKDSEIETLVYPNKIRSGNQKYELNAQYWLERLAKSGKDRITLWQDEYLKDQPDGMSYSQFCYHLKKFKDQIAPDLSYPKQREAGKVMEIDWCGDRPELVYDRNQGRYLKAHFFVTSLGFSQKIFAAAYPNEKQEAFVDGTNKAFYFYGALPKILMPDNTKTAVKKANNYDPEINPVYASLCQYYNLAIVPARPKSPRDKDRVEYAVNLVQSKIIPNLKEQIFFSFSELNEAIVHEVDKINKKPYQKRPGSRQEVFEQVDLPAMKSLPAHPFQTPETKMVRVSRNGYHVSFDQHQYSAPYHFAGKKLLLVATSTTVELLYDNKRIAIHPRCYSEKQIYVTNPEHMPKAHQAQYMEDCMTGKSYLDWAKRIGPNCQKVIVTLLSRQKIEEQAYRTCMGILRLSDKYSKFELEQACKKAVGIGISGYRQIKKFIEDIREQNQKGLNHKNIRGSKYYTRG